MISSRYRIWICCDYEAHDRSGCTAMSEELEHTQKIGLKAFTKRAFETFEKFGWFIGTDDYPFELCPYHNSKRTREAMRKRMAKAEAAGEDLKHYHRSRRRL